jgi:hypothetical protein
MKPKKGLYAFWHYDTFPYFLGGKIMGIHDGHSTMHTISGPWHNFHKDWVGLVEIEGYGSGFYFKPLYICSAKEGKQLKAELSSLKDQLRAEEDEIKEYYNILLFGSLPDKMRKNLPSHVKEKKKKAKR